MHLYQRVTLLGNTPIGEPGPLPDELVGLEDVSLADLNWVDPELGFAGQGFVPMPAFDPETERLVWNAATRAWDAEAPELGVLLQLRNTRLEALAARRYAAEEAGTTLPDGTVIATDRITQGKVTAAYIKAKEDPAYGVADWKIATGVFISLTGPEIIAIADAIEAHVQACFTRERELTDALMANLTDIALVDIDAGWPA